MDTGYRYLDLCPDNDLCSIYFRSGPLKGMYIVATAATIRTIILSIKKNGINWGGLWEIGITDALAGPME